MILDASIYGRKGDQPGPERSEETGFFNSTLLRLNYRSARPRVCFIKAQKQFVIFAAVVAWMQQLFYVIELLNLWLAIYGLSCYLETLKLLKLSCFIRIQNIFGNCQIFAFTEIESFYCLCLFKNNCITL